MTRIERGSPGPDSRPGTSAGDHTEAPSRRAGDRGLIRVTATTPRGMPSEDHGSSKATGGRT